MRYRRPQNRCSNPQRWCEAVATLAELQEHYEEWWGKLPESLQQTALGEKLQAIGELDLDSLQAVEPPLGFGRD